MKGKQERRFSDNQYCRVCGWAEEGYFPYGEDGQSPTYHMCDCCGAEFGFNDEFPEDAKSYRIHWLEGNQAQWFHPDKKPENWSLEEQLRLIPKEYR